MKRFSKLFVTASALALSLFATACDDMGDFNQPQLEPSNMTVMSTSGNELTVVYEKDPEAGSVTASIGRKGGFVGIGPHVLYVPEGAVRRDTDFTIVRDAEKPLRVKLIAGKDNEVGRAGFRKPVYLALSLNAVIGDGNGRGNPLMIYYREDGLVEELQTFLYEGHAVAYLDHFSIYGLAWP